MYQLLIIYTNKDRRLSTSLFYSLDSLVEAKRKRAKAIKERKEVVFTSIIKGEHLEYGNVRGRKA